MWRQRVLSAFEADLLAQTSTRIDVDALAGLRRKLALVLVVACVEGIDYPLSEDERIAVRRRLDFYALADEKAFVGELERGGWRGTSGMYGFRGEVVLILKDVLAMSSGDGFGVSDSVGGTRIPLVVSSELKAVETMGSDEPQDEGRRTLGVPEIQLRRLSAVSNRSRISQV
jgi:hypothetical protein